METLWTHTHICTWLFFDVIDCDFCFLYSTPPSSISSISRGVGPSHACHIVSHNTIHLILEQTASPHRSIHRNTNTKDPMRGRQPHSYTFPPPIPSIPYLPKELNSDLQVPSSTLPGNWEIRTQSNMATAFCSFQCHPSIFHFLDLESWGFMIYALVPARGSIFSKLLNHTQTRGWAFRDARGGGGKTPHYPRPNPRLSVGVFLDDDDE